LIRGEVFSVPLNPQKRKQLKNQPKPSRAPVVEIPEQSANLLGVDGV